MGATTEDLRAELEVQRSNLSRDVEAIGDRVTPGRIVDRQRAQARRSIHDLRDRVMGTAHSVQSSGGTAVSTAESTLSDVGSAATGALADVRDRVTGLPDQARSQTRGAPLVAGAVAFGIGALVGAVIAPTRKEQELVRRHEDDIGQAVSHLKAEVSDLAAEAREHLEPEVTTAASDLADQARVAAADVKEHAAAATSEVGGQATDAVDQIRQGPS